MRSLGRLLIAAAFTLNLVVIRSLLFSESEAAVIAGRFSLALLLFLIILAVAYLFFFIGLLRFPEALIAASFFLIMGTILAVGSNAVAALEHAGLLLACIRILVCAGLILGMGFRLLRKKPMRSVAVGACLLFSLLDVVWVLRMPRGPSSFDAVDSVSAVMHAGSPEEAVLIIGDSFAAGSGVSPETAFPGALQRILKARGDRSLVMVRAARGAGLSTYTHLLADLPASVRVRRIVLAYYHNDFVPVLTLAGLLQQQLLALPRSSPSLGFLLARAVRLFPFRIDSFHRQLIRQYAQDAPFNDERWDVLEKRLGAFRQLASLHSDQPPLFLIIPLMVSYCPYPLQEVHLRLQERARRCGFETLDLYPAFKERFGSGESCRLSRNDSHCNEAAHLLIAEQLYGCLR